jgi:hypothetical protein
MCQSQGYFATDSLSVLALSPSGTHDQILAVVKTVEVSFVVGRRYLLCELCVPFELLFYI